MPYAYLLRVFTDRTLYEKIEGTCRCPHKRFRRFRNTLNALMGLGYYEKRVRAINEIAITPLTKQGKMYPICRIATQTGYTNTWQSYKLNLRINLGTNNVCDLN